MPSHRRTLVLLATGVLALLAGAAPAAAGRAIALKMPRIEVPPRSDREVCTFVRLPRREVLETGGSLIVNVGGSSSFTSHHFLMWAYQGASVDAFPPKGVVQNGEACLDFGPIDRNQRMLIGGSQSPRSLVKLPRGLAQQLPLVTDGRGKKVIGLILNTHWINGSDETQHATVKVKLLPPRGRVKRFVQPIFEVTANGFINVLPGQARTTSWAWRPGAPSLGGPIGGGSVPEGPACVVQVSAHMHRRGKLFTVDFDDGATQRRLFEAQDYSDPGQLVLSGIGPNPAPLLVSPGQRLIYRCTHDNGLTTDVRMGCEEEPGVPPGLPIAQTIFQGRLDGASKLCATDADCPATDPAYPNRSFTGRCVPARLVFGFTSNDDMCILPGAYYDAIPDAPPGRECDLSLL